MPPCPLIRITIVVKWSANNSRTIILSAQFKESAGLHRKFWEVTGSSAGQTTDHAGSSCLKDG